MSGSNPGEDVLGGDGVERAGRCTKKEGSIQSPGDKREPRMFLEGKKFILAGV